MLSKVNYLNVTIWTLGGGMLLFLIGIIIWRVTSHDHHKINHRYLKVAKDLVDLSRSLDSIYAMPSLVNILFKNRFSNKKFSVITMLTFFNKNAYLIANPIQDKQIDNMTITSKTLVLTTKSKSLPIINLSNYFEIMRYLHAINLDVKLIIPTHWKTFNLHQANICALPIEDIGEYIKNDSLPLNEVNTQLFISKINKLNLFKKRKTQGEIYG